MKSVDDYKLLADEIRECTKCPLCASRNAVVVDRGDPTAKLMFIGEAPGANEDAVGQAFVGRAGAELDSIIHDAGIEKFIIVNVLKCRPPNNKFPGDNESYYSADVVRECLPWLDRQLQVVKPKVIVLVGGKAASHTIYRGRQTPAVGNFVGKRIISDDYDGIDIYGMYHTSYMLRLRNFNRAEYDKVRAETVELLRSAQRVVTGESASIPAIHLSKTPDRGDQLKFF